MFLYTMGLLKKSWRQVNLRNHEVNDPVCVCAVPLGWLALVMRHWGNELFRFNIVNSVVADAPADALGPCVARTSAPMFLSYMRKD